MEKLEKELTLNNGKRTVKAQRNKMTKRLKVDNKDGLKYKRTSVKKNNVVTSNTRLKPHVIVDLHSKIARKAPDLAKFRLLKRVNKVEEVLRAPFLHDDHGLEEYIRMIVRSEKRKVGKNGLR